MHIITSQSRVHVVGVLAVEAVGAVLSPKVWSESFQITVALHMTGRELRTSWC